MLSAQSAPPHFRSAAKRNYTSAPRGSQGPLGTFRKTGTLSSGQIPGASLKTGKSPQPWFKTALRHKKGVPAQEAHWPPIGHLDRPFRPRPRAARRFQLLQCALVKRLPIQKKPQGQKRAVGLLEFCRLKRGNAAAKPLGPLKRALPSLPVPALPLGKGIAGQQNRRSAGCSSKRTN